MSVQPGRARAKVETPDKKRPRQPLTIHRNYLIDIRRYTTELGWNEGDKIEGKVRDVKGRKLLEISLL